MALNRSPETILSKKLWKIVRLNCQAAKIKGQRHPMQPHVKGISQVDMYLKVGTNTGFLNIEVYKVLKWKEK